MNQYRCETCEDISCKCNPKQEGSQFSPNWIFTRKYGCASHSEFICQGKKVMDAFVSLITSEMVYDDGDMYYKVNPEKYVEVLGWMVSGYDV